MGTGIYYDESSICQSAVHDGKVKNTEGGEVLVTVVVGQERYEGSLQNEIQSVSFGAGVRSFTISEAPSLIKVI